MGSALSKDGWLTNLIQFLPGGGFVTAPFHFAAGKYKEGGLALAFGVISFIPGGAVAKGLALGVKALKFIRVLKGVKGLVENCLEERNGSGLWRDPKYKERMGYL